MGLASAHAQTGAVGVHACAPPIVALVGTPAGAAADGELVTGVCKAWPGKPAHTIAALAYDDGRKRDKPLVVVLVDESRSAVVARYDGLIEEDAMLTVGPGSLGIDTARYQLASGVRAFGLDISTSYSQGCVEGGVGPMRTLFVQEGKRLRPVLERLYLSDWRYVRGGPSCADAREDDLIETVSYSIGIGKAVHHGFASLRITATSDIATSRPRSVDLHYDGQAYNRPGVDWNR
jgi:hypothetical protein